MGLVRIDLNTWSFGDKNMYDKGVLLLDVFMEMDLSVVNTLSSNKIIHMYTWQKEEVSTCHMKKHDHRFCDLVVRSNSFCK